MKKRQGIKAKSENEGEKYYALYDKQTGNYLNTGLNSRSLEDLKDAYLEYLKADMYFLEDPADQKSYNRFKKMDIQQLANLNEFRVEEQDEPFKDEEEFSKGGEVGSKHAELSNIHTNIMGTASFDLKIPGMRKAQDFIVLPIDKDSKGKKITIQSDTRIGMIDLESGKGLMSQSHSGGAYFHHLSLDKKTPFELSPLDAQNLRMQIFATAGENVGDAGLTSDNSGAIRILENGGRAKNPYYVEPISGNTRRLFHSLGLSVFKRTNNGLLIAEKIENGHATGLYGLYTKRGDEVAPPKYQFIDEVVNPNGFTRVVHADGSSGAIEAFVQDNSYAKGGKIEQKLAHEFSRLLLRDMGIKDLKEAIKTNHRRNDDTDATHDYIDSNMTMWEAFKRLFGRELDLQNDKDVDLVNNAWTMAKSNDYFVDRKLSSGGEIEINPEIIVRIREDIADGMTDAQIIRERAGKDNALIEIISEHIRLAKDKSYKPKFRKGRAMASGGMIRKAKIKIPKEPYFIYATVKKELPQTIVTNKGIFPKDDIIKEFEVDSSIIKEKGGEIGSDDSLS